MIIREWECVYWALEVRAPSLIAAEHLLHLAEEAFGFGAGLAGLLEFLEQLFLLGGEVGRRLDVDLDIHVAALTGAHDRHALAAQAELVAALGAGRDVDARHLAVERRHLDVAAERGLHHGNRHAAMDVGALALEQLVAPHRQEHVEIAGRPAARARFALAAEADARAVLDAGGDVDLQGLVAPHPALAHAAAARLVDHLARTVAGMAGTLDGEEALLGAQPATAVAGRALLRLGTGLGAAAVADLAGHRARHAHRGFGAGIGLFQGDLEIEAQILAAHVGASAATARPAGPEHLLEDVAEHRAEIEALALEAAGSARSGGALEGGGSVAVVGRALLRILQDVVGVGDVLELLLGGLIPRIAIRMVLHGEFTERLLEIVGARRSAHSEQLVIVLRHTLYAAPTCRLYVGPP